ncbi:MAG: PEGA domain-containing protein [Pseudomonadota bacterium]
MAKVCGICGALLGEGASFCGECGSAAAKHEAGFSAPAAAPLPPISAPVLEDNSTIDSFSSPSGYFKPLHWWQSKKFAYGGLTVAIVMVIILSVVILRNFGGGKIQPDRIERSAEAPLKSKDKSPSENTQYAENVSPGQTEAAKPLLPDSKIIVQQESPGESPSESLQTKESAGPEQTLYPQSTPSVPNAILQLAITPWGEVYVDGKRQGTTPPLTRVSIAPGKHRIEIKNTTFPAYSQTYDIKPNEKLKISHKFK